MDIDDLEALESDVLDDLDARDDADAPEGTMAISSARRRRALGDAATLLDGS